MESTLRKKTKQKRLRFLILLLLAFAAIGIVFSQLRIEKTDYSSDLQAQIDTAKSLLDTANQNIGNSQGQYSLLAVGQFEQQLQSAQTVLQSKNRTYTQTQTAFEQLKQQTQLFEKAANQQVLTQKILTENAQKQKPVEFSSDWGNSQTALLSFFPTEQDTFSDINPLVLSGGLFADAIQSACDAYSLSGFSFTLPHIGEFGCKTILTLPLSSPDISSGTLYRYSPEQKQLERTESEIVFSESNISFTLHEGGDYFFAFSQSSPESASASESSALPQQGTLTNSIVQTPPQPQQSKPPVSSFSSASSPSVSPTPLPPTLPAAPPPSTAPSLGSETITVSLEIRCDPLANDISKLRDESKKEFVPKDGTILKKTEYQVAQNSTVFDVLTQVCKDENIQIEYSYYSGFQTYYIEGIHHLYEFDGGQLSGWLYRVNGVFPNYGCSSYSLKNGDSISLLYTCDGGEDVGNNWKE